MVNYKGKPADIVRAAKAGDPDFKNDGTEQVVIKLEDGTEKTVPKAEVK